MPGKGDTVGKIATFLRNVPRTSDNDDLYAPPAVDGHSSLDDLAAAVELARNELVTQEAELARAQQLYEDMKTKFAEAVNTRNLGVTASANAGRRH